MLHKIKIIQSGWETFSGDYCGYPFTNGVSDHPLPRNICDRIAALVHAEIMDDAGDNMGQGGAAARIAARSGIESTVMLPMARMSEDQKAAEQRTLLEQAGKPAVKEFYTRDQLTVIAEKEGIGGLREIAGPWGVKDRSIPKLIDAIVKAQNDFVAATQKRIEDLRASRKAALDDAFRQRLAEEQAFLSKARVIGEDTTPNAIDADGKPVYIAPEVSGPQQPAEDPAVKAAKLLAREREELHAIEMAGAGNAAANQALAEEGQG